jgi:hypothetical protein
MKIAARDIATIRTKLNLDLANLTAWMKNNKLILNLDKTVCMLVGTRQRLASLPSNTLNLTVQTTAIAQVTTAKLLGVFIDTVLSWEHQVEAVTNKISKRLGLIRRLRPVLPRDTIQTLFNCLALPHFTYCNTVWGNASSSILRPVVLLQNQAARILTGARRYSHVTPLYARLNWLRFPDLVNFHKVIMLFKAMNGLTPTYITELFHTHQHGRSTRNSGAIRLPRPHLECYRRSFSYSGARLWNTLPESLKEAQTVDGFKRQYLRTFNFA